MKVSVPVEKIVALRRAIHRNPELSNQEHETQRLVRETLTREGISGVEVVADTGLVVDVVGTRGAGPMLGLRADMDALPIQEATDLSFASRNPGVMHACGHDAHTAILFGAVLSLHERRDQFAGTVRCVFQPAEEAEPSGGRRVVESGILAGIRGVFALHVDPHIDAGKIGVREGALLAGAQDFRITVKGRAAHAAKPHLSSDALVAGAAVVQALQSICSRRIDPLHPAVVTIGKFHSGTASNIIADTALIEGTMRMLNEDVRREIFAALSEVASNTAAAYGASVEIDSHEGDPVLVNDSRLTHIVRSAAHALLGDEHVIDVVNPSMGSEDFAFYVTVAPVSMFRLGVRNESLGYVHPLHNPHFAIDENALEVGAKVMVGSALTYLDSVR